MKVTNNGERGAGKTKRLRLAAGRQVLVDQVSEVSGRARIQGTCERHTSDSRIPSLGCNMQGGVQGDFTNVPKEIIYEE